jgi:hypothetical protein
LNIKKERKKEWILMTTLLAGKPADHMIPGDEVVTVGL